MNRVPGEDELFAIARIASSRWMLVHNCKGMQRGNPIEVASLFNRILNGGALNDSKMEALGYVWLAYEKHVREQGDVINRDVTPSEPVAWYHHIKNIRKLKDALL